MLKAPKFWYKKKDTYLSAFFYPFSILFRLGTKIRNLISTKQNSPLPIICIGNIVVGGAGKTPVALSIGKLLIKAGYRPHFVSKGYAGIIKVSTCVQPWHSAKSVGDESILLSEVATTWIGNDRINSSKLAKKQGGDCIIMDDGFQNPTIKKDFSIIVINGEQEFGNNKVLPSGPLRESINAIKKTQIVLINGNENKLFEEKILSISNKVKIFYSKYLPENIEEFKNKNLFAFAGIGNPKNFFKLLADNNLNIHTKLPFPDHYKFTK